MSKKEALGFYWEAELNDGTVMPQFNGEDETLFSEVENNMSDLAFFRIVSSDDSEVFEIDFANLELTDHKGKKYNVTGSNPSLIYKRRNHVRMEVGSNKILDARVNHIIGLKTDSDEMSFEVDAGQGMRPKKVNIKDKDGKKTEIAE